jgi:hypothetical protein
LLPGKTVYPPSNKSGRYEVGKELYYIAPDGKLMAAPIAANGATITPGTPVALFQTRMYGGGTDTAVGTSYDVSSDGRFLIDTVLEDAASPITLLLNWSAADLPASSVLPIDCDEAVCAGSRGKTKGHRTSRTLTLAMISLVRMFIAKHSFVVCFLHFSNTLGTCRVPWTRIRKRKEVSGNFSKM